MTENAKPNLLLIMCDQLRADALGCYGNSIIKTPNIDRMAKAGICFVNAYSQTPVCIPARLSLITGRNPFELGLLENGPLKKKLAAPLAEKVRNFGYYTCAIGKMHYRPHPRDHHGFDKMYLSEESAINFQDDEYLIHLREEGYAHVTEHYGRKSENYYVPQTSELPEDIHSTAWTGDKTCEIIRKNRNRPFFIFTSFIKPHPPFDPCKPFDTMYEPEEMPMPVSSEEDKEFHDTVISLQNDYKIGGNRNYDKTDHGKIKSHYYGCVSQIDRQIGKILDALDKYSLRENTFIIFLSDHGEMLGDHLSYGKRTFFEQAAKIPLILSWPNKLPADEKREQFALLKDIYTTFVKAVGGDVDIDITGKDLIGVCLDRDKVLRDKVICEYGDGRAGRKLKFMLRWDRYKYIYYTNGGRQVLYDLKNDPGELHDIADKNASVCDNCRKELFEYYKSYKFFDAINDNKLKIYEYEEYKDSGYKDKTPKWIDTVIDD